MSAKFVVADAGPLIALAVGGVLAQATDMLGGIYVPEAVIEECTSDVSAPGSQLIAAAAAGSGFELIPTSVLASYDAALAQGLGTDEIAVLAFAQQHKLVALIDLRRARRVAARLQIAVIGRGAVLAQLKLQGRIASVNPVLKLWQQHACFVWPAVVKQIVLNAGEAADETGVDKSARQVVKWSSNAPYQARRSGGDSDRTRCFATPSNPSRHAQPAQPAQHQRVS